MPISSKLLRLTLLGTLAAMLLPELVASAPTNAGEQISLLAARAVPGLLQKRDDIDRNQLFTVDLTQVPAGSQSINPYWASQSSVTPPHGHHHHGHQGHHSGQQQQQQAIDGFHWDKTQVRPAVGGSSVFGLSGVEDKTELSAFRPRIGVARNPAMDRISLMTT